LLHLCTAIGNELMGTVEELPISWAPEGEERELAMFPADHTHFPAGARKGVVREDARMTTVDGESHLLSLGEFCAMHLLAWHNALWPKKLPTFDDLFWQGPLPVSTFDTVLIGVDFPPGPWQLHTGLYDGATVGLKRVCDDTKKLRLFTPQNVGLVLKCISENAALKEKFEKETEKKPGELNAFRDGIPKVRRALANVSTYMMFDDHEVTDDWNLSAIWRDRVLTSPLGRTVLRNGLLAYLLCQGWGNDPQAFLEDTPTGTGGAPQPSARKRLLHLCVPRI